VRINGGSSGSRSTMNQAGHAICGETTTIRRGSRVSGKDHTEVLDIEHSCNRASGHRRPHRNGEVEWGKGKAPHSMERK
jgi:hypothetical protein